MLGDSWLFRSDATTRDVASNTHRPATGLGSKGPPVVIQSLDVDQAASQPLPETVVMVGGSSGTSASVEQKLENV